MNDNTAHRRLSILRHLAQSSEYTSNASILVDVCRGVGIPTTTDQMRTTLAWLQEQELIELTDHSHVVIATATARGVEVAHGQAAHPGVKKPSPRS
ncbi:VpaChn25_0724 family phage protein [Pseudaestuariivita sp.]|uniref:VpaChn25_0724 family phage protein n=1 Tax=Pseudaestuariivita sp. TaxID=2211669 RepID=UPI0040590383